MFENEIVLWADHGERIDHKTNYRSPVVVIICDVLCCRGVCRGTEVGAIDRELGSEKI